MDGEKWRHALRLLRVAAFALLLIALAATGLAPATRVMALVFMALIACIAVSYELSAREAPPESLLLGLGGVLVTVMAAYGVLAFAWPPDAPYAGPLVAATEPTPQNICDGFRTEKNNITVLAGKDAIIGPGSGPFTPIRVASCSAFTLERKPGGLMVNAHGYDRDGSLTWRIDDNDFEPLQGQYLQYRRPDAHTLVVLDRWSRDMLRIRYINANTVRVRGRITCAETQTVTIADSGVTIARHPMVKPLCASVKTSSAYGIEYSRP